MLDEYRSGRKFVYEQRDNFNCLALTQLLSYTSEDIFKLFFNLRTPRLIYLFPWQGLHHFTIYLFTFGVS